MKGNGKIEIVPIGVIRTPYKEAGEVPIQASRSSARGTIEVFREYEEGLKDVEGFSHVVILFHFHKSGITRLLTKPFLDDVLRGVFATRSPNRPNHLGISVVRLLARRGNLLEVEGVDMLDGTPLIDIKPYVSKFDDTATVRIGWLEGKLNR